MTASHSPRRWFQFSLLMLLTLTTITAVTSLAVRPWFYPPSETVTVVISEDGRMMIGDQTVSSGDLVDILDRKRQTIESWGDEPVAIVLASAESLHSDVVLVLDAASRAGFLSVKLETLDD